MPIFHQTTVPLLLLSLSLAMSRTVSAEPDAEASPVCRAADPPASCGSVRGAADAGRARCTLWRTESLAVPGGSGVFTSVAIRAGEAVGGEEPLLPLLDVRRNEWSPWHDLALPPESLPAELLREGDYLIDGLAPGLPLLTACSNREANVVVVARNATAIDAAGVHRMRDPAAGSFSYYRQPDFVAARDLEAGEELIFPCAYTGQEDTEEEKEVAPGSVRHTLSLPMLLQRQATCLDTLRAGPSTVPGIGRGAFGQRSFRAGEVVAESLLMHFDRSQVEMVRQEKYRPGHVFEASQRPHGIRYTEEVTGQQLLLNYAYGHPDSNVLLVPYSPAVNLVNHRDSPGANVFLRWRRGDAAKPYLQGLRPMDLFATPVEQEEELVMELVALRNIAAGEEIFLDYGRDWSGAWDEHQRNWRAADKSYLSAADFRRQLGKEPSYRTLEEQEQEPYPSNLQMVCYFSSNNDATEMEWSEESFSHECIRPCDILSRTDRDGQSLYNVLVKPISGMAEKIHCRSVPMEGIQINSMPSKAVTIMDKPYSSDFHMTGSFRQEIMLPRAMIPDAWLRADPNPNGDFIPTPLVDGQLDHFRWTDNGRVVMDNGYRLGLPSSVRQTLLEYCEQMGIIDLFREVTVRDNGFVPGDESYIDIHGQKWFMQRPVKKWHSNLHWLSPGDETAHQSYLQALSLAGFDDMLKAIGEQLGLDSLVVYHVTFIAVSQSTVGYMHSDVFETDGKTFNVIVPLIKAPDAIPELDLQQQIYDEAIDGHEGRVGRYSYEVDVAALMGDNSIHGTSAVDYRQSKGMRLAATIYIADVTPENAESISDQYTQAYPPSDPELLLSVAGKHWRRDDPSKKLPMPSDDHILLAPTSEA